MKPAGETFRPTTGPQSGFTLIEALAALILLSTTLGLFGAALRFEQKAGATGHYRDELFAINAGTDALSHLLARAVPMLDPSDDNQARIAFSGRPETIAFVALSAGSIQRGGFLRASVGLHPLRGGDNEVTVETSSIATGAADALLRNDLATTATLIPNVRYSRFRYFGTKLAGQPAQWYDQWDREQFLPQLVMMTVQVHLRGGPRELEFVYRLSSG